MLEQSRWSCKTILEGVWRWNSTTWDKVRWLITQGGYPYWLILSIRLLTEHASRVFRGAPRFLEGGGRVFSEVDASGGGGRSSETVVSEGADLFLRGRWSCFSGESGNNLDKDRLCLDYPIDFSKFLHSVNHSSPFWGSQRCTLGVGSHGALLASNEKNGVELVKEST